jgi:glycosyltransferase involved in cell wall biosynthesis
MSKPKKIIHVLGAMNIGGIESWLMNILRVSDRNLYEHDFLVHKPEKAYFDEEIKSLGSHKYICDLSKNIFIYLFCLFLFFRKIKPDVVHSHVHDFSGLVLMIAWLAGVKTRISHSHSDTRLNEANANFSRKIYLKIMKKLIALFSTSCLAVSNEAACALYGEKWVNRSKCKVIYCGIDYERFKNANRNINYRETLNIPLKAKVIGHVGRLEKPKNHIFLLKILYEIRKLDPEYYLVLVGDGTLREKLEEEADRLAIRPYVKFMGSRSDVPEVMVNLFDIFVFPSLWEGLPLTLVEAQFSGLNCLVADNITKQCDLGNIVYLNNNEESLWIKNILKSEKIYNAKKFDNSIFNLVNSNLKLYQEYN